MGGSPLEKGWVSRRLEARGDPFPQGRCSPVKIPTVAGSTVFPNSGPELTYWSPARVTVKPDLLSTCFVPVTGRSQRSAETPSFVFLFGAGTCLPREIFPIPSGSSLSPQKPGIQGLSYGALQGWDREAACCVPTAGTCLLAGPLASEISLLAPPLPPLTFSPVLLPNPSSRVKGTGRPGGWYSSNRRRRGPSSLAAPLLELLDGSGGAEEMRWSLGNGFESSGLPSTPAKDSYGEVESKG